MSATDTDRGPVLVTGAAGFVGYHTAERLLSDGVHVVGFDDLNDYYDPQLKKDRLALLRRHERFLFVEGSVADESAANKLFSDMKFPYVVHLAAQAGVRYSLEQPRKYASANLMGFVNMLECCRHNGVRHLVYASSSSVYGANVKLPYSTSDSVDHPVSLYAATKKSNEILAHAYSHLFALPTTGLRFFTVYGPWGRPDMAYFSFTRDILAGKTIRLFNNGDMRRDFTYIDDIVEGIVRVMRRVPVPDPKWDRSRPDPSASYAPYKVYNIGNNEPVRLLDFVAVLEELLGKKAVIEFAPMQPGDVRETYADISGLMGDVGFAPYTNLRDGLRRFVEWYCAYYNV